MIIRSVIIVLLLSPFFHYGQKKQAVVADAQTRQGIPWVHITQENKGVISNENGAFIWHYSHELQDSIHLSSIGYKTLRVALSEIQDSIFLIPEIAQLKGVVVTDRNLTAEEIIERVKENTSKNLNFNLSAKSVFLRKTYSNDIIRFNSKIKHSSISEIDQKLIDSILDILPKKDTSYTESLADWWGNTTESEQKIAIRKAVKLSDTLNSSTYDHILHRFQNILKKRMKKDSYFKVKSGLFISTSIDENQFKELPDTLSAEEKAVVKKQKEQKDNQLFATSQLNSLKNVYAQLFDEQEWNVPFLKNSSKYNYHLEGESYYLDEPIYIIQFKSKKSKGYKGTLYISAIDFGVYNMIYSNRKHLKRIKLFGVFYEDFLFAGTLHFIKSKENLYNLHYVQQRKGEKMGIDRPFKVIEKNKVVKGKNKQNELSFDLNINLINNYRLDAIIYENNPIDKKMFKEFNPHFNVKPIRLHTYDSLFWKDENIIPPNTAIQNFEVRQ